MQQLVEKLVYNGNIHQVPFSNDMVSNEREKKRENKKINWRSIVRNTCMKLNCSINLHLRFYKMSAKHITLNWQYSHFNGMLDFFFQQD